MKSYRRTLIISTIVCLIPVIAGIILYPRLPDQLVTHWGANGEPNGWQSKFVGAIVFPGMLVILNLLLPFLIKLDPKKRNISFTVKNMLQWIIPIVGIMASGVTLANSLGIDVRVEIIAPMIMGLIFIIMGNYIPKASPNYTVGFRLPWTLDNEQNWFHTHRIAGFVMVIGGILILIGSFLSIRFPLFIIVLVLMVLIPVVCSYLYYRKHPGNEE